MRSVLVMTRGMGMDDYESRMAAAIDSGLDSQLEVGSRSL